MKNKHLKTSLLYQLRSVLSYNSCGPSEAAAFRTSSKRQGPGGDSSAVGRSSRPARVGQPRPPRTPASRGAPKTATPSPGGPPASSPTIGATSRLVLAIATAVEVLALEILHDAGRQSGPGSHGPGPLTRRSPAWRCRRRHPTMHRAARRRTRSRTGAGGPGLAAAPRR